MNDDEPTRRGPAAVAGAITRIRTHMHLPRSHRVIDRASTGRRRLADDDSPEPETTARKPPITSQTNGTSVRARRGRPEAMADTEAIGRAAP
jgi:hypothetical protein